MRLPWLQPAVDRVRALLAQGRLPHALLLKANEGWGEVELANLLALELLERPEVDDARTLAHPDLRWVAPEGAVIKVDDIRELSGFSVGTRQSAPRKVAVIEAADLMNPNAANALLKTLEEPPSDTYLLLTSCRPARLLPTIVSRCQQLEIKRNRALAREWLLERWSAAEIEEKLFECGEAPLSVHQALTDEEPILAPLLESLAGASPVSLGVTPLLDWDVDRLTAGWYRHCVALLARGDRLNCPAPVDRRRLLQFVEELKAVRYQLLMTNSANQRLLYERLAAKWYGAFSA
jgi:DNA polymerase-3 subunit delta'